MKVLLPGTALLLLGARLHDLGLGRGRPRLRLGDFLTAFTCGIVSQALLGLAFGIIYRRTGNLLAPTLLHVASHLPVG